MHNFHGSRLVAVPFVLVAVVLAAVGVALVVGGHQVGLAVSSGLFALWCTVLAALLVSAPSKAVRPAPASTQRGSTAYRG
jgi:hypothetical protein